VENDDADLVRRVLSGDVQRYRTLVERHRSRVLFMGLKFFRRVEDAEDFAQEVFLRAFEKLSLYSGKGPFAAWLYRVAYNVAVNTNRAVRQDLWNEEIDEQAVPGNLPSAEELLASRESVERVGRALKGLPARYSLVVRMHYFDGLSYPEIADILDVPVNTIKSHIFRAKEIIRSRLVRSPED
jgi:RNA polymerase sigma-70 factor, ECF subfamily